jgi:hypothetical protein
VTNPLDTVAGQDEFGRDVTVRQAMQRHREENDRLRHRLGNAEARIDDLLERLRKAETAPDLSIDDACRRLRSKYGSAFIQVDKFHSTTFPNIVVACGRSEPVRRCGDDVSAAIREALDRRETP